MFLGKCIYRSENNFLLKQVVLKQDCTIDKIRELKSLAKQYCNNECKKVNCLETRISKLDFGENEAYKTLAEILKEITDAQKLLNEFGEDYDIVRNALR